MTWYHPNYYKQLKNKRSKMYKLTIIKTDGTETEEEVSERPSFKKVYALINTDMIQIVKGYDKHRAKRPFEMWIDEEAKLKKETKKNSIATTMWYDYLEKTNAGALFGDVIYGDVALVMTKENADSYADVTLMHGKLLTEDQINGVSQKI